MRLVFVSQRYGGEIVGGAEAACRMYAERLVERGHDVEVITSCARNYSDWANEYEPGISVLNGVRVHRLPVTAPRSESEFGALHRHMIEGKRSPHCEQERWGRLIGPELAGLNDVLDAVPSSAEVVICMSYLYWTTTAALQRLSGRVPLVLHPTAHPEPMLEIPRFFSIFRLPDRFFYLTPEEENLVTDWFDVPGRGAVVGLGCEAGGLLSTLDSSIVRERLGIGEEPYLLYVGRADATKGYFQLLEYFNVLRSRLSQRLKLVVVGPGEGDVKDNADVIMTGFLDEDLKFAVMRGALALVQPSFQESFSIVLCEAWSQGRPAIVQDECSVLRGQAMRSGGALRYGRYEEFEECVILLMEDEMLQKQVGLAGQTYFESNYQWSDVMGRYEVELQNAIDQFMIRRRRV